VVDWNLARSECDTKRSLDIASRCDVYRHAIYFHMFDDAFRRLLDFDRRRYWLSNGWSIRFRITEVETSEGRPHGIKYAFTLHDVDRSRLLGFDNAHGIPRVQVYDHRHRFRRTEDLVSYDFRGAGELICDFFAAVEDACRQEGVAFEFDADEVEYLQEEGDDPELSG
jgi:hypothetical protein